MKDDVQPAGVDDITSVAAADNTKQEDEGSIIMETETVISSCLIDTPPGRWRGSGIRSKSLRLSLKKGMVMKISARSRRRIFRSKSV